MISAISSIISPSLILHRSLKCGVMVTVAVGAALLEAAIVIAVVRRAIRLLLWLLAPQLLPPLLPLLGLLLLLHLEGGRGLCRLQALLSPHPRVHCRPRHHAGSSDEIWKRGPRRPRERPVPSA